ncbi:MAG: DNA-3-methyladenine glycosylase 2 family protein [bacterium]|nr:DNA-3-methyladenine glycosylase 2 family protein [bacterium]
MSLDPHTCYRAVKARDARFDGRFFTAVRSTGVYCRPVCPAPLPRFENCTFVACAAAAQEAGYRPCLRCRPEVSPGTPAWLGSSATVSRALRLIADGALVAGKTEDLAARLGIGDRQLRRLFVKHLGASPIAVEQTRRLLFAKKLIDETALPMTQVAFSSGFSSVRRFNDTIRTTYARTPSALRKRARARRAAVAPAGEDGSEITLRLPYREPFDWAAIIAFLQLQATPHVESVLPDAYCRTIRIGDATGIVEVRPSTNEPQLLARICLSDTRELIRVSTQLRRIFDLDADPNEIRDHLASDGRLRPLLAGASARVPGVWDGFELAVRAILAQQVSLSAAATLASRLVRRHGETIHVDSRPELSHLFPTPCSLRSADLSGLGMPKQRTEAIHSLSAAVDDGELQLDAPLGLEETVARLCQFPGIGEWTAQYIAMRATREPDAFPDADLVLRKALGNGSGPVKRRELREAAEAWRPWRAYAAMHLWAAEASAD